MASLLRPLFRASPPIINVLRTHSGTPRTRTWLPLLLLSSPRLLLPFSGYQLPTFLGAYCGRACRGSRRLVTLEPQCQAIATTFGFQDLKEAEQHGEPVVQEGLETAFQTLRSDPCLSASCLQKCHPEGDFPRLRFIVRKRHREHSVQTASCACTKQPQECSGSVLEIRASVV